jgi:hypothetical protein
LTSFCSKNHCPLVLSRYYHYLVHCAIKSVLATHSAVCKVLCMCLSVITKSNVCCTIYTATAVLKMGFSYTSLIITSHKSTWNDMTIFLCKQHSKTLLILTQLIKVSYILVSPSLDDTSLSHKHDCLTTFLNKDLTLQSWNKLLFVPTCVSNKSKAFLPHSCPHTTFESTNFEGHIKPAHLSNHAKKS